MGDGVRSSDIGCPSYSPSVTTAGDVSVTGNLSAAKFIGDGSALTGLATSTDRITSGTSSVIVNSATSAISFTTAGSQRMVIDGSGNVGIGTTSPGKNLDIYGASNPGIRMRDGSRTFDFFTAAGRFAFYDVTSMAERLTVGSTGNVGIGTTSPNATLHVSGTATITSNTIVSGTVKISGVGNETCGPSSYNTIRVNPTTGAIEMCRP